MDESLLPLNPIDWDGGRFLALYIALVALTVIGVRRGCADTGSYDQHKPPKLNSLEIGYLVGGAVRAADTMIVLLLQSGAASLDPKGEKITIDTSRGMPDGDFSIVTPWFDGDHTRSDIRSHASEGIRRIRSRLAADGLVATEERVESGRIVAALLLGAIIIFGFMKLHAGISRGRPVGILEVCLVATIPAGILATLRLGHPTLAGRAALRATRLRYARAVRAPQRHELAFAFALAGPSVLNGTPFEAFGKRIADSVSGCGSGCGGGGGGGGGGSGCGGCSGGQ